jgi:Domain of unknown function (DUF6468)
MTIDLVGDLLLASLLLLTITWCVLLARRLRRLKVERGDIAEFLAAIDGATQRAEAAIAGMRETARETQLMLSQQREATEARMTELTRLAEGGAQLARRLETVLHRGSRSLADLQNGRESLRPAARPASSTLSTVRAGAAAPSRAPYHTTSGNGPIQADESLLKTLEALR